jgi:hypothetical protein
MHCEHSVHVRERIAELDAKANDLERERDEAQEELAHAKREIAEFKGEPAYGETSETYAMYKDWKAQLHAVGYEQCNVSTGLRLALKELADAREEDKRWRGEAMNADADGSLAMERAEKAVRERDEARAEALRLLRRMGDEMKQPQGEGS